MPNKPAPALPSHKAIIARNGGPASLGRKINVDPNTVKGWNRLDSIPAPHWHALAEANAATLDELAAAAARRIAA
ncbi:carph-isopro domain-containing protein [Novosphingobium sp. M1R2S20]|uniref:Carph-isopro domain-containing protein n=1 Tax=Novosphingobium rhizovicinum TaxID=3228928 RepID=A0ABV3REG4_9SPHN